MLRRKIWRDFTADPGRQHSLYLVMAIGIMTYNSYAMMTDNK
jgi:hypothetical protein